MQYTTHYNLTLPEGTDIVNPLIQDNPNYSAIDTALYDNKLRVIGNATHTKVGTNHSIVLADSDIKAFKFVASGDYVSGDTFTVDGVTVTGRVADGSTIPNGAFKINSTVEAILDGTLLNLINVTGTVAAGGITYDNNVSGLNASNVQDAIDELNDRGSVSLTGLSSDTVEDLLIRLNGQIDRSKIRRESILKYGNILFTLSRPTTDLRFGAINPSQADYIDILTCTLSNTPFYTSARLSNNNSVTFSDLGSLSASGTTVTLYY